MTPPSPRGVGRLAYIYICCCYQRRQFNIALAVAAAEADTDDAADTAVDDDASTA